MGLVVRGEIGGGNVWEFVWKMGSVNIHSFSVACAAGDSLSFTCLDCRLLLVVIAIDLFRMRQQYFLLLHRPEIINMLFYYIIRKLPMLHCLTNV
jgi:hypothetical protein